MVYGYSWEIYFIQNMYVQSEKKIFFGPIIVILDSYKSKLNDRLHFSVELYFILARSPDPTKQS
jgi:hypothetical protein